MTHLSPVRETIGTVSAHALSARMMWESGTRQQETYASLSALSLPLTGNPSGAPGSG